MKNEHALTALAAIGIAIITHHSITRDDIKKPAGLTTEQHQERYQAAEKAYAEALKGWSAWNNHIREAEAEMEKADTPGAVAYIQRRIAGMEEERDGHKAKMDKAQKVRIRSKMMQEHGGQFMPPEYADPAIDDIDLEGGAE